MQRIPLATKQAEDECTKANQIVRAHDECTKANSDLHAAKRNLKASEEKLAALVQMSQTGSQSSNE